MLIFSSITIGSLGASTVMQPAASAEPSIAIVPAVTLRFPMSGLCAVRTDLVKFALLMAVPRFRGAEWRIHRRESLLAKQAAAPAASHRHFRSGCLAHLGAALRGPTRSDPGSRTDRTSSECRQPTCKIPLAH